MSAAAGGAEPTAHRRADGRAVEALRPVTITPGVQQAPAGSCVVAFGATRVLCAASFEDRGPRWRPDAGWVTAEYAMLPGATSDRTRRERNGPRGRTQEIQRLVGRSLRAAVDLDAMPPSTITVDCDVLEADGGTRTASITGGWVALALALRAHGLEQHLRDQVAAVSVGVVDGTCVVDLPYVEDVAAEVDMNVVALTGGRLVEVQGTGEHGTFDRHGLDRMLDLALAGCEQLFTIQRAALEAATTTDHRPESTA